MKTSLLLASTLLLSTLGSINSALGQCGPATIAVTDYCPDQYAEFDVTNNDPNTRFHWYDDALGTTDLGYGPLGGDGSYFTSPATIPTGSGMQTYYYQREISGFTGGPLSTNPTTYRNNPLAAISNGFEVPIDANVDFVLRSVTVPLFTYYLDPNKTFVVQIEVDGTFAQPYYFTAADVTSPVNNVYLVDIPIDIDGQGNGIPVTAGNNIPVRANSITDATGEGMDFAAANLTSLNNSYDVYNSGGSSIVIDQDGNTSPDNGQNYTAAFYDWEVDISCPMESISASEQTNASLCCTPVALQPVIATNSGEVVFESPFSATIDASSANATHYYQWFLNGVAIPGAEGLGNAGFNSLNATATGNYTLRVVEDGADIGKLSCYNESAILQLKEKMLFAQASATTICLGESVTLTADGSIGNTSWTPTSIITDPTAVVTSATPTQAGPVTISVSALVPEGNLAINSDFEDGNTGFDVSAAMVNAPLSDQTMELVWVGAQQQLVPHLDLGDYGNQGNGVYTITNEPGLEQGGWWLSQGCTDHTSGTGNYYLVDALTTTAMTSGGVTDELEAYIWKQDVVVEPNTAYDFSAWFANASADPGPSPEIQFYVNNQPVLVPSYAPVDGAAEWGQCDWHEASGTWNSGNFSGSVEIKIVADVVGAGAGNDFMMDDVFFSSGNGTQTDDVTITVQDCFDLTVAQLNNCPADSVELEATTNGFIDRWEDDQGNTFPGGTSLWVNPSVTTTYTAVAKFPLGNQVINGDFELGNQGFQSDLNYGANNVGPGGYSIGTNPNNFNATYFVNLGDQTSGTGNMAVFDAGSAAQTIWETTVNVTNGENYAFSVWVADVNVSNQNPPILQFVINGDLLDIVTFPANSNDWIQFTETWTANTSGNITIELINRQTGSNGNDFAMDDVVFAPLFDEERTQDITVTPCCAAPGSTPSISGGANFCDNGTLTGSVAGGNGNFYGWFRDGSLIAGETGSVTTGSTGSLNVTQSGTYKLFVASTLSALGGGCSDSSAALVVTVTSTPAQPTVAASASPLCEGDALTLTATPTVAGLTYQWSGPNGAIAETSDAHTINAVATADGGNYSVIASNGSCPSTASANEAVVVNSNPTVTVITATEEACSGTTVDITDNFTFNGTTNTYYDGPSATGTVINNQAAINASGTYYLHTANGQCDDEASVTVTITTTPAQPTVAASASPLCEGDALTLTATPTVAGLTYQWSGPNGAIAETSDAHTINAVATADAGNYSVIASNGSCPSTASANEAVVVNANPTVTVITATEDACSGTTIDITDNFTFNGTTNTYYDGPSATGTVINNQAAINASGTYYLHTANGQCDDEASVVVTINPLPIADISGTTTICNDGSDQATITINFTAGSPDFDWVVDGDGGDNQSGTASGNSTTFTTMLDQDYMLTSVQDGNGCTATSLAGNADITFSAEPGATQLTSCPNANNAPFEYLITVTMTGGDAAYSVTGQTQSGPTAVNFTDQGGGIWVSDPISELETVNVIGTDGANCAPVSLDNINRVCSCPEVATIAIAAGNPDSLCINGTPTTTDLEVTFTGGAAGQTYDFEIVETGSNTVTSVANYNGDTPYSFPGQTAGTYIVQNVQGSCSGSGAGSIVIANYDEPAANITGGGPICSDGSNDTTAQISLTSGQGPFNVSYNPPSGTPQSLNNQTSPISIPVDEVGNYSLLNITDANGCTADAADLTGSAISTSITPSLATITDPATDTLLTDAVSYVILATDLGAGYTMNWTKDASSTQTNATLSASTGATTTVNNMDVVNNDPNNTTTGTTIIVLEAQDDEGICPADDDTVTIIRVNESVPDAGPDDTLCASASYTQTGSSPIPGIETVEWVDVDGAMGPAGAVVSSTTSLNVNVNSPGVYTFRYEITNSITARTNTDEFILQIDETPSNVTMTEVSPKITCSSTEALPAASPAPVTSVGTWSILSQPAGSAANVTTPSSPTSTVTGLISGNTLLQWSVTNGVCPAVTDTFSFNKLADITDATISLNGGSFSNTDVSNLEVDLCTSDNYTMTGNPISPGESGTWSTNGGSNVTIGGALTTNTQPLTTDATGSQTTWTWSISNPALPTCPSSTFSVTYNVFEAPDATFTLSSSDTCEGADVIATATTVNASDLITWTSTAGSGSPTSPTASSTSLAGLSIGTNTIQLEINNDGCPADVTSNNISIEEVTTPYVEIDYSGPTTLCAPATVVMNSIILEGGNNPTYDWKENTVSVGSNSSHTGAGLSENNYVYELTMTSSKRCVTTPTATAQKLIQVLDGPEPAIAQNDTTACASGTVTLEATGIEGSIQWFNASGALPNETGPTVTVSSSGSYYYTDDIGTCPPVLSSQVAVTFETEPVAIAQEDFDVCFSGEAIVLSGNVNTSTWHWDDNLGMAFGQNENPTTYIPVGGGTYVFDLTAEGTVCPDATDQVTVQVRAEVIPHNVFTPNGDGRNEDFNIEGIETYPDAIVRIYNKWGNLVYETYKGYSDNPWDGSNKGSGETLPVGTYYYVIDLADGGACGNGSASFVELMK